MRVDLCSATRRGGTSIRSSAFPTARLALYVGAVPPKLLRMLFRACLGLGVGLSFAANGAAVQALPCASYSFINEDGIVEMSNAIRPALADRGYSCLAKDGTVLEVVPPKRTANAQAKPVEKAPKETGPHLRTPEELRSAVCLRARRRRGARSRHCLDRWFDRVGESEPRDSEAEVARLRRSGCERGTRGAITVRGNTRQPRHLRTQIEATGRDIETRRIEKRNALEQFELDLNDIERFFPAAPNAE